MQEQTSAKPKKKLISIGNVAFLLVATMLVGQLLGFLRTRLVNANFPEGGPESTGAYFAAFNIPDFFFYTLSAGVLGVAFIPILADRLHKGDRRGMWELCSSLLNLLCIVMFAVAVVIFVFAEPLIKNVVAPGLTPEQLSNAATIMRFLALNPLLFTLSGILTSVQQTMGRFFFFAIAPLFYNLSIIASIYVFKDTGIGLTGLGIGALAGGLLQLLVVSLGLIGTNFRWKPKIMWRRSDFRTVLRQLPPRSLDQGLDQVQTIVETNFASRISTDTITYYNNAYMLQTAPVMLVGTSIATAAFPRMAGRLSQKRPDLFRSEFLRILRFMIWIIIPVVIVAWFARGYLARLIFAAESPEIALIFGFLTGAIFFRTLYAIISRWFYAQKDTKTPLFVSMFILVFVVGVTAVLARPNAYGAAGLAFAISLAAMVEVFILSGIMVKRDRTLLKNREFWNGLGRIVSVSGFSLMAGYIAVQLFPLELEDRGIITLGTKLAFITLVTFGTHVVMSRLFGLNEVRPIFAWIKRVIFRPVKHPFNPPGGA
jgi:putative peptidoglycan lipid II flippase